MGEEIQVQIGEIRYSLSGGSFNEMVEKVKAVPGRRFRAIPNDKHWVLPVTLEAAETALSPYKLTSVGRALKVAMLEPSTMPTSPEEALHVLREHAAQLNQLVQDVRDIQYLFDRDAATLGGAEKTLVMRCARALLGWKG